MTTTCTNPTCPVPGLELPDGATKCWRCGAKVETAATQEEKEACVLLAVWRKEGFGTDTSLDDFLSDNASKVKRRWLAVREAARAPLEAEVARLKAKVASEKEVADDWRATSGRIVAFLLGEPCLVAMPDHTEELVREKVSDLRAKLEAAERRQPVDREAAVAAVLDRLEFMSRDEACEAVTAILGAQKAEPPAFVPALTGEGFVERELPDAADFGGRLQWLIDKLGEGTWQGRPEVEAIRRTRDHAELAQKHAAAVKRVAELEKKLDRLRAAVARLSAPCPADGMTFDDIQTVLHSAWISGMPGFFGAFADVAAKALELFGRAKP